MQQYLAKKHIFTEIVNTMIEEVVTRIGLERYALSGLAKDLASAALIAVVIRSSNGQPYYCQSYLAHYIKLI